MLLYTMLRRFNRPKVVAWTAGILLATMASYWSNTRSVGEDALLAFGVSMALLAFFRGHGIRLSATPCFLHQGSPSRP